MQISKEKLSEYARLIVRTGANVQPGQVVQLSIAVEQHEFAALITEEAYLAGAKKVNLNWLSDGQNRLHYRYAEEAVLSETLPWEKEKLRQMTEDLPVRIFIESEDPDALAGLDPEKLSRVMQSRAAVAKPYRDEIDGRHQWCIAALPSEAWARKCFPGRSDEEAMELLYDAVFRTVRISDHEDAVDAWHAHTERIEKKSTWLNAQGFTSLRYESSNGTDFTVELIPEAHWEGAGSTNCENGVYYIPNMPTEEIFTSPLPNGREMRRDTRGCETAELERTADRRLFHHVLGGESRFVQGRKRPGASEQNAAHGQGRLHAGRGGAGSEGVAGQSVRIPVLQHPLRRECLLSLCGRAGLQGGPAGRRPPHNGRGGSRRNQ